MKKIIIPILSIILLVMAVTPVIYSQETPFISEKLATYLNNELSGDRGFEYIRWQSHYHRPSGSKGYEAVAKLLYNWAKEFNLENVQIVEQKFSGTNWDALSGELWVTAPREIKLGSYAEIAVSIPNNCPSAHETAELVYIGDGFSETNLKI